MSEAATISDSSTEGVLARFRERALEDPQRVAISAERRTATYGELLDGAADAAGSIAMYGLEPGDRVGYVGEARVDFYELMLACMALRLVLVPVNWRLAPNEAAHVLFDADPALVIAEDHLLHLIPEELCAAGRVQMLVLDESESAWFTADHTARLGGDPPIDDVAWIIYTSGTTGAPKGVELTHGGIIANLDCHAEPWRFLPGRVIYMPYPTFHIVGTTWILHAVTNGASVVLRRRFDVQDFAASCVELQVTNALLVPTVLQMLLSDQRVNVEQLASLRTVVYGASPISESVLGEAVRVLPSCEFVHAYGLTENTGVGTVLEWVDHVRGEERIRSCGRAAAGVELRIVDPESGTDLAAGSVGEVWMRSAAIMNGYFRQPDATAGAIVDGGWLRTGDLGRVNVEGYLFLTDRLKDMIVSGGENIYPAEVENVLYAHPAVLEVAVVGVPDDRWGESVKAVVVLRAESAVDEAELIEFARVRLAHYKCPGSIDFRDELPKNPTGKILRRELRDPYWHGRSRSIN